MSEKKRADAMLQQCYNDFRIKLFNYCLARLDGAKEAADDCVQETFIVFYDRLLKGENFENPRAFLYRTADNFVKRQKKKAATEAQRTVPIDSAAEIGVRDDYDAALEALDLEECAKEIIESMDDEEKQLYELRYIKKLSVEETAQILEISRPAASMRLLRLRNRIKNMVYELCDHKKGG